MADVSEYPPKRVLSIGCGNKAVKGQINLDLRKLEGVNIVADASRLPFREGSFDLVLAFDVLEHFGRLEIDDVLLEWHRILKTDGELRVKTPNLETIILRYFRGEISSFELARLLYGTQDYKENLHSFGFTPDSLQLLLLNAGFKSVKIKNLYDNDINNMLARARA